MKTLYNLVSLLDTLLLSDYVKTLLYGKSLLQHFTVLLGESVLGHTLILGEYI